MGSTLNTESLRNAIVLPDPGKAVAKMKRRWEDFIRDPVVPQQGLHPEIFQSWQRCLNLDVNPETHSPAFLNPELVQKKLRYNHECMSAIKPVVDSVDDLIDISNHLIAFVDRDGYVLEIFGSKNIQRVLASINFRIGANWNERFTGTTAVGIALKTGQPSHVFHAEHYCRELHEFTCTAVPIRNPFSKKVIGALNFVAYMSDHQPHSMGMALQMGRCVELEIYRSRKERDDFFREYSTQLTLDQMERGVVVLDDNDRIRRANLKALDHLGVESRDLLNKKLKSLKIFAGWQDLDKPTFINAVDGVEIRLARQPIVHQKQVIGSLILLEKNAADAASGADDGVQRPIGRSPAFRKILEYAENTAKFDSNVLIMGETGTGKEVIAQYIHEKSMRSEKPLLAINCGSIPRELLGSELFGYEAGAFTGAAKKGHASKFELTSGGTLLLDEISEMPLESQVYLLRVIEERAVTRLGGNRTIPVDIRFIAASNKDLQQEVQAGRFRADLFFRLNVLRIDLPALKERKDDIPLLTDHFLRILSESLGKTNMKMSDEAMSAFMDYEWPGNIRELRNAVEQTLVMTEGPLIRVDDIPKHIQRIFTPPTDISDKDKTRYVEFVQVYNETEGNISKTAKIMNVSRPTVYAWRKKFGIPA